ncbi:threonine--tRNA ligase [Candidatus Saccharibacteria bacterium CG10_big_fil_rev_8_21_14_0_10_47_8]|nr:MAG: threonine--tRNA ligase [Candidatus Saccharibacteria bacterium CG10_big_fil_rev_8_21_14_0_10_47_8]
MDDPKEGVKLEDNDHRRLGQELDLFTFSDLVGAGLPLWTPRGTILRQELDNFVQEMRDEYGFQAVTIPHITKSDLYKKSGHWTKFSDDLFHIVSREKHEFAMKPMNCPHHTQIYASRPRSYRELPIRYRETTMNYRDEQTGELNGLLRARSFTQDDAHVFCREEDILQEVLNIWSVIERFYKNLGFDLSLRFSRRDPATPEAYAGTNEMWERAEAELQKAIDKKGVKASDGTGDAAFYGPKLDFVANDSLGREWQVATIQLDFAQPEGLDLTYTNSQDENQRPVMIHCAIMGSIERFLAVYIEHTGGKFPVWLAPEQVRVATLNDTKEVVKLAREVVAKAKELGVRATLDDSNESVGKKIRDAEVMKVPYTVVVGTKELENNQVAPRVRSDLPKLEPESFKIDDFLEKIAQDAKNRR